MNSSLLSSAGTAVWHIGALSRWTYARRGPVGRWISYIFEYFFAAELAGQPLIDRLSNWQGPSTHSMQLSFNHGVSITPLLGGLS